MIEFKNLHKRFGKLVVLDGLDLEINKGGIFAILGPNGSGKTTLIKCLLGMVIPNKGDIIFEKKSVLRVCMRWWVCWCVCECESVSE